LTTSQLGRQILIRAFPAVQPMEKIYAHLMDGALRCAVDGLGRAIAPNGAGND
jgi:hypothetical protein